MGNAGFFAIAAILLALPGLLAARGAGYYSPRRRALLFALRLGSAAALVVAAGGLVRRAPAQPRELVAIVDVSASIGPARRAFRDAFLEQVLGVLPPGATFRQVRFAGAAAPARVGEAAATAALPAEGTNLARAIEVAKGFATPGREVSLLLLTDGEETEGSAAGTLEGLRRAGIQVLARELPAERTEQAAISRVLLPSRVIPRERFEVKVAVRGGGQPTLVRLAREDGGEARAQDAPPAGREQELAFAQEAPGAGALRLRLRLEPGAEGAPPIEERLLRVPVAPPVPVTILSEVPAESHAVRELFEEAGLPVTVLAPDLWRLLPGDAKEAGLIVLDNVPAPSLGVEGMERIERLVRAGGAGLLVFGGMQSLGAGGYAGTPLERVLPAVLDAPGRGPDADLGLVIVLDASLSMYFQARGGGGAGPFPRKIELAKAAVLEVVGALRPEDRLGLLASRDQLQWVRRPAPLGDRAELEERVLGIHAIGGGINFYSSIREAYEALRLVPTRIRHVMLLADANDIDQLEVEDVGRSPDLIRSMAEEGVTLSVFALGAPSDKDVGFLRRMAQLGRGDFYLVVNEISLPRYFRSEYQRKIGERIREGAFDPLVRSPSPVLRGLDVDRLPETTAINLLAAKPGAEEILVSPFGAPLLTLWRYGRGRAAVFSGDSGTRWARSWFSGAHAQRFWMQLAYELAPRPPAPAIEAVSARAGNRLNLLLRRRGGALLPPAPGRIVFDGPGSSAAGLERQGLLQFGAPLPAGEARARGFRLEGGLVGGLGGEAGGFVDLAPPPELRPAGRGRLVLTDLVEGTGGAWVRTPAEVAARIAPAPAPAVPLFWLLLVALLFLLGEILLRY